ncbi:MAG TPA: hypothetical protein VM901_03520 [Bdellovibrionota bacterium]|jgi:class 3 adenylate cyclase|nr:hypothetical protein [Bdellovibrionota bacterium]
MNVLEKLLLLGVPELRIPPKWRALWQSREHSAFSSVAVVALVAAGIIQILHSFFVDQPLHLEPALRWQMYRFSIAALAFGAAFVQWKLKEKPSRLYSRVGYVLWAFIQSYFQAKTMSWSDQVPYGFVIAVPCLITIVLRSGPLLSLVWLFFFYAVGFEFWNPVASNYMIISGAVLGAAAVAMFRARMNADVEAFIAVQENLETQGKLIESQMDLNNQIKSFLPKIIYERFINILKLQKSSSLQAMDEVLRLRRTLVACMYSDIRGYTELSKNSVNFMANKIIPNIRRCTEIVEINRGVSKLVGDLVFAYFDDDPELSILRSAVCAYEIYAYNTDLNTVDGYPEIRRHMIISFGEVLLGNVGGVENAREITVMGSPPNLLSRIDQLTKHPQLRTVLSPTMMILSRGAASMLEQVLEGRVKFEKIELSKYDAKIRDFPEETEIYVFEMHKKNYEIMVERLNELVTTQRKTNFMGVAA